MDHGNLPAEALRPLLWGKSEALLKPTGPPDRQRKFLPAGPTPSGKLGLKSALSSTKIRVKVDFGDKYDD